MMNSHIDFARLSILNGANHIQSVANFIAAH